MRFCLYAVAVASSLPGNLAEPVETAVPDVALDIDDALPESERLAKGYFEYGGNEVDNFFGEIIATAEEYRFDLEVGELDDEEETDELQSDKETLVGRYIDYNDLNLFDSGSGDYNDLSDEILALIVSAAEDHGIDLSALLNMFDNKDALDDLSEAESGDLHGMAVGRVLGEKANKSSKRKKCRKACSGKRSCKRKCMRKPNLCFLPSETGPCKALKVRYYYDLSDNACKKFIYGGCRGNENRFDNVDDCGQKCVI
uniref:BPTI/Kunitz inhibitor domain-containing protein n=1 Tax=Pseudictyota dubia TaxID=2749911 RepID=A0A7R9VCS4_9STRA|mmetsp:Transcript_10998/g.20964  ORF Transcript_10998/g.20964 Transcript_10998/m.20964 type:complete len:256 (+) Transcript_10998:472-1239(+)